MWSLNTRWFNTLKKNNIHILDEQQLHFLLSIYSSHIHHSEFSEWYNDGDEFRYKIKREIF